MSQSPKRPYSLATAHGKMRIWGAADEPKQDEGEPGGDGGSGDENPELTAAQQAAKDAEAKAQEAEKKAADAEKRAKDAEKTLQDKEREGMEEGEKLKADHDDLQKRYDKLLKIVETSVIDSAITNLSLAKDKQGNPKYNWQDIEAVRAFIKRDEINLDLDTGDVSGLDVQLKDIAAKRPYLLVTKQEQDDNNGNQPPPPPGGPATGSHPTGGSARQRETDRTKLGSKYKIPGFVGAGNVGARPL